MYSANPRGVPIANEKPPPIFFLHLCFLLEPLNQPELILLPSEVSVGINDQRLADEQQRLIQFTSVNIEGPEVRESLVFPRKKLLLLLHRRDRCFMIAEFMLRYREIIIGLGNRRLVFDHRLAAGLAPFVEFA